MIPIRSIFAGLRAKPKSRHHKSVNGFPDREHEIIINRLIMVPAGTIAAYALGANQLVILGFYYYLFGSLAIALAYRLYPQPSNVRRFAGLCVEFSSGTLIFYAGGEHLAAAYVIYLWAVLGHGFRFGKKWLFIAMTMATLSFGWIVTNVQFWIEQKSLSMGLFLGLIAIPTYCATLITKLSKAKEEAEAANKAKSLFLASISHELRTPLNAIIGYGTHLLGTKLPMQQQQMVATSVAAGRHLLHLINQLLSFAQSESREEPPEPNEFAITDLLAEVRDIMKIAAEEKGLDLHLHAKPFSDRPVLGQSDNIKNILINLTSNAIKFTDNGSVTLSCALMDEEEGLQLRCTVSDTGPGIAPEAREKIFEVFQQADDTVINKFGGTGLGLAICRQLAQNMDGDIELESTVGEGSSFTLSCLVDDAVSAPTPGEITALRILSVGTRDNGPVIIGTGSGEIGFDHFRLSSTNDNFTGLAEKDLTQYDIAIIGQEIAVAHEENVSFWEIFSKAQLPPVLLSDDNPASIEDVRLRAAFASVLPATPDFDEIRSVVRIGCSFASSKTAEKDDNVSLAKANRSLNILVADDNRTNRMVLETILTNATHNVVAVSDGEEALEQLENQEFDIVFLDVNMPKIGGIECSKLWRQIEGPRQHVPIIGLTADSTEETEKKCLDAGMDLRLTKPIEAGTLLETIAAQTAGSQQDQPVIEDDPLGVVQSIDRPGKSDEAPPFDSAQIEYLRSIGDDEFVQSIVDAYLVDTAEIMDAFKKSVADCDVSAFRFHAHAFKSGANNVGAVKMSEICGKLENITEADFIDRRLGHLERVQKEVERIKAYLSEPDDSLQRREASDTSLSASR